MERSALDFMLFGVGFIGFLTVVAGVGTASIPASCTGLVLIAFSLCFFFLRQRRENGLNSE